MAWKDPIPPVRRKQNGKESWASAPSGHPFSPMVLTTHLEQPLHPTTNSREALSDGRHVGRSPARLSSGE
jgi:hypothetical protein